MTRVRLNWVCQIFVLVCVIACGSSNSNTLGSGNPQSANAGGQVTPSNVGGTGANNGGGANTAGASNQAGAASNAGNGNGASGNGTSGSGTAGANSQAGNSSGTGSSGSTTDGGAGNGGGTGNVGGDYFNVGGGNGTGGVVTVDVAVTGGTGSSTDIGSGGGNSVDIATGGGYSIDVATGGGNSVDMATGGGNSVDMTTGGGSSVDMTTGGGSSVDMTTGGGGSIDFGCTNTTLTNINVYVIKDATPSGADTEGNMYVGGNLIPTTAGYSVGAKDVVDCTIYSLVVAGNVSNVVVKGGKAAVGGTNTGSTDQDCGGITRGIPAGINFATLASEVENLSIAMSQLTPNCTKSTNASGALVITGTDPTLNVCDIDASQLGNVNVNFPAGSAVVVNVTGTSISWSGASVCLNGQCADSTQADSVVWNFYQATSIYFPALLLKAQFWPHWQHSMEAVVTLLVR